MRGGRRAVRHKGLCGGVHPVQLVDEGLKSLHLLAPARLRRCLRRRRDCRLQQSHNLVRLARDGDVHPLEVTLDLAVDFRLKVRQALQLALLAADYVPLQHDGVRMHARAAQPEQAFRDLVERQVPLLGFVDDLEHLAPLQVGEDVHLLEQSLRGVQLDHCAELLAVHQGAVISVGLDEDRAERLAGLLARLLVALQLSCRVFVIIIVIRGGCRYQQLFADDSCDQIHEGEA
mmetsp:Transcript_96173/g.258192  ORF Transcript_96173/g.258192 Transcript_96173/m.258192 type:complete len:232 (+) Transcript_96173:2-697(+)